MDAASALKKQPTPAPRPLHPAPPPRTRALPGAGGGIGFNPALLAELGAEHQLLMRLLADTARAHRAGDLPRARSLIAQFRSEFTTHLLKENVRLYLYLDRALGGVPGSHCLVRQFREEADTVTHVMLDFVERYLAMGTAPQAVARMDEELTRAGMLLLDQMRSEEDTLFSLYLPDY